MRGGTLALALKFGIALPDSAGLHFRIHLRDACGKQSCWIEPLGNCACEGHFDEMYQVLENFFAGKRASIEYDESKLNFWILSAD